MSDKTLLNDAAELRRLTSWALYRLGSSNAKRQGGESYRSEMNRADAPDTMSHSATQKKGRRVPEDTRPSKAIEAGEEGVIKWDLLVDREERGERVSVNMAAGRSNQAVA